MNQKDIFLEGEGDKWFERNKDKLGKVDVVSDLIAELKIMPTNVLEVGCANGWRLLKLREKYGCQVLGIDPSMKALMDAYGVPGHQMTASCLPEPIGGGAFDTIIYGFCLYLTDPKDWLTIAAEGDRALAKNGYLIIHDFDAAFPFSREYKHDTRVRSYHVDFAKLWLAHPDYLLVTRRIVDLESVTVLRKRDGIPRMEEIAAL